MTKPNMTLDDLTVLSPMILAIYRASVIGMIYHGLEILAVQPWWVKPLVLESRPPDRRRQRRPLAHGVGRAPLAPRPARVVHAGVAQHGPDRG